MSCSRTKTNTQYMFACGHTNVYHPSYWTDFFGPMCHGANLIGMNGGLPPMLYPVLIIHPWGIHAGTVCVQIKLKKYNMLISQELVGILLNFGEQDYLFPLLPFYRLKPVAD